MSNSTINTFEAMVMKYLELHQWPTKTTHPICTHCGLQLDAFGICPNASPKDAANQKSPVNCREQSHPDECQCDRCKRTRLILSMSYREKADAAWKQADAACAQADATREKADAACVQADATWEQAYMTREQAYAACEQAYATREHVYAIRVHAYATSVRRRTLHG